MDTQLMDTSAIIAAVKTLHHCRKIYKIFSINIPNDPDDFTTAQVHVKRSGMTKVAPPQEWEWHNRPPPTNPIDPDDPYPYPYSAHVVIDGVTFLAIFTEEEAAQFKNT